MNTSEFALKKYGGVRGTLSNVSGDVWAETLDLPWHYCGCPSKKISFSKNEVKFSSSGKPQSIHHLPWPRDFPYIPYHKWLASYSVLFWFCFAFCLQRALPNSWWASGGQKQCIVTSPQPSSAPCQPQMSSQYLLAGLGIQCELKSLSCMAVTWQ